MPAAPVPGDLEYLPGILKAYRDNDLTEAQILKTKLTQPAAHALVEWFAIRSGFTIGLDRIVAFQKDYPEWPSDRPDPQARARMRCWQSADRPPQVRAFFAKQPPGTPAGRIALAFALKADGLEQEANDRIRHVWREDNFGPDMERRILDRFPDVLSQADHRFRMERLLLKENWGGAQRAAGYAGKDHGLLVKARMAVFQGKKKAEKAFAAVPGILAERSVLPVLQGPAPAPQQQSGRGRQHHHAGAARPRAAGGRRRVVGRAAPDHPRPSRQGRPEDGL